MSNKKKKRIRKIGIITFHTLKWECIILGIVLVGKQSYERKYEETKSRIEAREANKNYNLCMLELEDISFQDTENLSEKLYNETSVKVGEDEFYQRTNEELLSLQTKEQLETFVWKYLREYISRNNAYMSEERVTFEGRNVEYGNKEIMLDADGEEVLGNLLESMYRASEITSYQEKKEWMEQVKRQILATELYEVTSCSPKKLVLNPCKREFE